MTHSTKAIYRLLLSDYVKVSKVSVEDMLYDENDIIHSMDKIEVSYINILFISFLLFSFPISFFLQDSFKLPCNQIYIYWKKIMNFST
jgi:hypothetical protein